MRTDLLSQCPFYITEPLNLQKKTKSKNIMLNIMKIVVTILSTTLIFTNTIIAQLDSISDQGIHRTFIVHLPTDYSTAEKYPLVLNLHGLSSSAGIQQNYTQFDNVANSEEFVVVYPNGVNNSWSTIGNSDSDFLSNLVDTIRANYSINNCLFVTGMSQGGFMTYKFANTTRHNITAIAVGSGNMSNALQNSSTSAPQIPIMHFHGTDDNIVSYDGTLLISSVENTIQWWVEHNDCNTTPVVTAIPDIDLTDNSTVEKFYYGNGVNESEVTFYKVTDGGHTWSGAVPIPAFGATNQDIIQSEIIGDFFSEFCSTITGINETSPTNSISVFPNPFISQLTINANNHEKLTLIIYNNLSQAIIKETFEKNSIINTNHFPEGNYYYEVRNAIGLVKSGIVIKN